MNKWSPERAEAIREFIDEYLMKHRKLNMKQLDHRRRLIDSFVNAIYLFDDYLVITFNYKEGTKTITFAEIEEAFGSDLSSLTAPKNSRSSEREFFYPLRKQWHIINDSVAIVVSHQSDRTVSHHASACISSTTACRCCISSHL